MNNDELVLRQQRLMVRSGELRLTLKDQTQIFKKPLAVADQARSGFQWLSHNPQWLLSALLLLVILRPRRTIIWSGRLWWTWKTYKQAKKWMANLPFRPN